MVYVVEIKDDGEIYDTSPENRKKFEYARDHFERLNKWLTEAGHTVRYQHNWMSPKSFNRFFQLLREDQARGFRSELDVALGSSATESL
jgi:type III restriction enzyme